MLAVVFGVGTALCWGLADFLGGLRTRRLTLASVLLVSQLTGLAAVAIVVAAGNLESPAFGDLLPAVLAGACQLAGIAALYRGLAIGTMSVISPISASGAAAIPVVVGVATGERPGTLVVLGMVGALVGVTLATRTPDSERGDGSPRSAFALAAVAALGFSGFFIGMDAAVADVDPFWALLAARASAGAVVVTMVVAARPPLSAAPADLPSLALIGLLDVGANACFALGADTGLLSVVSVLASLYPVLTVVLARAMLGERLIPVQTAGVTIALAGVALIATG
jgi:drug/metabolite transporter (DMT)-like permease